MADLGSVHFVALFSSATVVSTSSPYLAPRGPTTYQATVTTTSTGASAAVTGQVVVQVSNDEIGWLPLGTCNPTGTGTCSDGFASIVPWKNIRMVISTLTTGVSALLQGRIGV